jgi:dTDP-4-amino-4,6-dideoxygalactose transaminase
LLGYGIGSLPETERAANEVLSLPIFPELTEQEQVTVVTRLAAILTSPVAKAA